MGSHELTRGSNSNASVHDLAHGAIKPAGSRKWRILLLNPNSSTSMTDSMLLAAKSTPVSDSVEIGSMTATNAPVSINNDEDIDESTRDIMAAVERDRALFTNYDAVLVACFSVHSLVPALASALAVPVTGIFEASILTALSLLNTSEKWGIVTTGDFWPDHLCDGVRQFFGVHDIRTNAKFAGVFSSGLTAADFHTESETEIRSKLSWATRQLLTSGNVTCVVMGCGGMAGLEDVIRSTAKSVYSQTAADKIYIIDGVKAGLMQLCQMLDCGRLFR